ncbi:MAG: polysaccharide pyruvyl transferase family protein [Candidatus Marinimicrobia bacterium]|nr:polysaccharide pyruvyl transferase family protein [Candidatus Neomarinimicrobiota bacterium]
MIHNIVLIGARLSDNLGGPSLAVSTMEVLKQEYPNANFTLLVPEQAYLKDQKFESKYQITVLPFQAEKVLIYLLIKQWFKLSIGSEAYRKSILIIQKSDLIADIWGIMFADSFRSVSFVSKLREGIRLVYGRIVKTPVVKYTAAMGPFKSRWNRFFAKYYLNNFVDVILARDETTKTHLKNIHISTPIFQVPDTAFLLPLASVESAKKNNLVGISVSYQARNRYSTPSEYTTMMSEFIRDIIDRYGINIIIIPNEIEPGKDDDCKIAVEINTRINHNRCKILETADLTASQIKGEIQECDVVIAARYHTIVASLSLGIPTLAIGWHHKYTGVLKLFHQENYMIDIRELDFDILSEKFSSLWKERKMAHGEIASYAKQVKNDVMQGGVYIHNKLKD